jgi:uncharacterized membrane protein required for colicin V production
MELIDILIIAFIIIGGFVGLKRGIFKELVITVGIFLITILSFLFKNPVSVFFYENLPFFKFGGIFKGVTVLNIALYEFLAFLVVFSVLVIIWKLVILASGLVQRIINMSFLLGVPSKIFGMLIGFIEFYFIAFIILYVLCLPIFGVKEVLDSKCAQFILSDTPIVSGFVHDNREFIDEFSLLKEKYKSTESASEFNYDTLDLFLKYGIIDINSAKKLREQNKLKIDGIDELLKRYEEE